MTLADPGWKGQPDDAEREPDPCGACEGLGFLWDQSAGDADIPDDFVPVQRCDACQEFVDDEDAARSAALYADAPEVRWFEGTLDGFYGQGSGDWAIGPLPLNNKENR